MRSKMSLKMLALALAAPVLSFAQSPMNVGDFQSFTSGDYNTAATWQKYDATLGWITATSKPGSTNPVYVISPHVITIAATSSCTTLNVQAGSMIKWAGTTSAANGLRIYGATAVNNGMIGGAYVDDSINIEVATPGTLTISGPGTTTVNRLRCYYPLSNTTVVLDQPLMTFNNQSAAGGSAVGLTAYYSNAANASTDNVTITINSGRTVDLIRAATLHYASQFYANAGGNYTYNVNGLLDMSTSKGTTYFSANGNTATSVTTLNVSGVLKTGLGWVSVDSLATGATPGTVHMNVLAGGVVDATPTLFKLDDSTTFVMADPTAQMKRMVAAQDTLFPISTAYKGNNSVTLHNSGTQDSFSVSLLPFGIAAVTTDLTQVVKTAWNIKELGTGAKLDTVKLTWLAADQGSNVTASSASVYVRPATGTQKEYVVGTNVTVTGSGTLASPYVATIGNSSGLSAGTYFIGKPGLPSAVANVANAGDLNVTVAPNPATNNQISYKLTGNKAGTYHVALYNVTGQVVYSTDVNYNANATTYKISGTDLAAGTYQLQITNAQTKIGQRVVVE